MTLPGLVWVLISNRLHVYTEVGDRVSFVRYDFCLFQTPIELIENKRMEIISKKSKGV